MIEKINTVYEGLMNEYLAMNMIISEPDVVIKVSGLGYCTLLTEKDSMGKRVLYESYRHCSWINLHGHKVPVVIDEKIPAGDMDFIMQLKNDYIRERHADLDEELSRMFLN